MNKLKQVTESFFTNTGSGVDADIENTLKELGIKEYTINSDNTVDAPMVILRNKNFSELPVKFRYVHDFKIVDCNNLISSKGFPTIAYLIRVVDCNNLKELNIGENIRDISVSGAKNLIKLDCSSSKLNHLYLSELDNLISVTIPAQEDLQDISLIDCNKLSNISWLPKECYTLRIVRCPSITKVMGQLPNIIHFKLQITDCPNIKDWNFSGVSVGKSANGRNRECVELEVPRSCNLNLYDDVELSFKKIYNKLYKMSAVNLYYKK